MESSCLKEFYWNCHKQNWLGIQCSHSVWASTLWPVNWFVQCEHLQVLAVQRGRLKRTTLIKMCQCLPSLKDRRLCLKGCQFDQRPTLACPSLSLVSAQWSTDQAVVVLGRLQVWMCVCVTVWVWTRRKQGFHRCLKVWKSLKFKNQNFRPEKVWKFAVVLCSRS